MSHVADSPCARREEIRSSAEAALPPPNRGGEDFSMRVLEQLLADALEAQSEAAAPKAERSGGTTSGKASGVPSSGCPDDHIDLFRSVLRTLLSGDSQEIAPNRAGLGSTIDVRDPESGELLTYKVVPFDLIDGSLGRVTIASPLGQVLYGARPGDVVEVETPLKRRTLQIEGLQTLWDLLNSCKRR